MSSPFVPILNFKMDYKRFTKNFMDTTTKCTHKNLRRLGGYIRKAARNSIKKGKKGKGEKYSLPGQPPLNKTGYLKNFIFFAWDATSESVVVGPAILNKTGTAPHALEYGGPTRVYAGVGVKKHVEMRYMWARPYMRPAAAEAMKSLGTIFKDSLVSHSFDIRG